MDELVKVDWLQRHLDDPDLVILEATVVFEIGEGGTLSFHSGRADWEAAHIPGSAFADILEDLSDPDSPYQFTLPSAARFGQAMGRAGIGSGVRVVVYDRTYTMWATRVWWMLRAFGFDEVAVLDGGFTAWCAAGAPVSSEPRDILPREFEGNIRPGWFVDRDEVERALGVDSTCLIDALPAAMYSGEQQPYARPGHIPGAMNAAALDIVDAENREFLPEARLREMFEPAFRPQTETVITYCGGGIAATADAFALRRLGRTKVAVYDGSLAEWSADASLPMEVGAGAATSDG